jgi:hypothetical protein
MMKLQSNPLSHQKYVPLLLFLLFLAGMAWIQFASPDMPDNDGFYHIRLAHLMRTEGLKPEFSWLPQSILNQDEYYDHHFLFHVVLTPFTFGDLRLGAKAAAVVFGALAFLSIWFLLHRQRVPFAWLWASGLLGISEAFLYRMSITRAQSLSLALLALGFLWLLERKYKYLAVLAFLYVWMYDAFPLLLALGVLYILSVLLIERRFESRPLFFIGAGILIGMLVNPYFPDNITFSIRHMLPKLLDATLVRVGNEWYPYETGQLLENSLPALLAFASGILALGLSARKMDVRTAFALLSALLFGLMLFQARRFVEYFPPFALIFAAFAWTPLLMDPQPASPSQELSFSSHRRQAGIPFAVLIAAVALSLFRTIPVARARMENLKPYYLYADAAQWLEQNTSRGDLVFQTDWDDFPRLFFYNTHNTYLIGLDPTYMQMFDKDLYDLWVPLVRGEVDRPSQFIANIFHARYVHTDLNHQAFIERAADDPYMQLVYQDEDSILYRINRP